MSKIAWQPSGCLKVAVLCAAGALAAQGQTVSDPGAVRSGSNALLRPVSWRLLVPNILSDQKKIWLFPVKAAEGKHWVATLSVIGVTGALIAADPKEAHYFRNTDSFSGFNKVFTNRATALGTVLVPVSLYGLGLIRKDSKMQRTAMLAGEAAVNGEILATVLKRLGRRSSPASIPANAGFGDSWFENRGSPFHANGSFPSGHTIAAFSVATVIARAYRHRRWVPYLAYGAAAAIGFSRLTLSAHFASDVFMGAALGYSISRFAVLRE